MPLSINSKDPAVVADFVITRFKVMHPRHRVTFLRQLLTDITAIFTGRHPDFQANDLRYHDY
ncbi:MAG: hypothetical protein IT582_07850, partial [Opitutaceae bacterium]|nr:hypothetical protein [Opitutaceae bacterium]